MNTPGYKYFTCQTEPTVYRYQEFCECDVRKEQELMATKYASTTYRICTLRNILLCTFGYHMETFVDFNSVYIFHMHKSYWMCTGKTQS